MKLKLGVDSVHFVSLKKPAHCLSFSSLSSSLFVSLFYHSVSLSLSVPWCLSVSPFSPLSLCQYVFYFTRHSGQLLCIQFLPFPGFLFPPPSHVCNECQRTHMGLYRSHNFLFIAQPQCHTHTYTHLMIKLMIYAELAVYTNIHPVLPFLPLHCFPYFSLSSLPFPFVFIHLQQAHTHIDTHTPCLCSLPAKGGARWRRSITVTEAECCSRQNNHVWFCLCLWRRPCQSASHSRRFLLTYGDHIEQIDNSLPEKTPGLSWHKRIPILFYKRCIA